MNHLLDKLPFQRRTLLQALFVIFAASLATTAALVQAESDPPKATAAKPVLTVKLIQAKPITWPQTVTANGNVMAWQESLIGTEIGGLRLIELNGQVGDWVKKGQLLAKYSDATVQAEVAQAQAAVAEAEAALSEAKQNADRVRQLGQSGAMSAQQMTEAFTREMTAKARVQSAKAQLTSAQVRLQQTRITAPDDGVISARSATLGAVSQPGQELFRLVRQGRLEWQAEVTAAESAKIKVGQTVTLTVPTGAVLSGTVRQVAPTVDVRTRNLLVYVDIKKTAEAAKPGMFAKGHIAVGESKAWAVPGSAVLMRDGFANVFVLQAGDKVKQVRVKLGRQANGLMEVAGLPANAQVVASGVGFLADGDTVRVVDKK